jgi:hypothetical protein
MSAAALMGDEVFTDRGRGEASGVIPRIGMRPSPQFRGSRVVMIRDSEPEEMPCDWKLVTLMNHSLRQTIPREATLAVACGDWLPACWERLR